MPGTACGRGLALVCSIAACVAVTPPAFGAFGAIVVPNRTIEHLSYGLRLRFPLDKPWVRAYYGDFANRSPASYEWQGSLPDDGTCVVTLSVYGRRTNRRPRLVSGVLRGPGVEPPIEGGRAIGPEHAQRRRRRMTVSRSHETGTHDWYLGRFPASSAYAIIARDSPPTGKRYVIAHALLNRSLTRDVPSTDGVRSAPVTAQQKRLCRRQYLRARLSLMRSVQHISVEAGSPYAADPRTDPR
jgi:hypothetical protein